MMETGKMPVLRIPTYALLLSGNLFWQSLYLNSEAQFAKTCATCSMDGRRSGFFSRHAIMITTVLRSTGCPDFSGEVGVTSRIVRSICPLLPSNGYFPVHA